MLEKSYDLTIDYANKTSRLPRYFVKVEGLGFKPLTTRNLTSTYKKGKTMTVDFSKAVVKGPLPPRLAEVKLLDIWHTKFPCIRVEVEYE